MDKDMIGQKFNKLLVIGFEKDKRGKGRYLCQCECGNTTFADKSRLITGRKKSCGCLRENPIDKYSYLIGQKINKWTVLDIKYHERCCYAACMCECGTVKDVNVYNLINNKTKDCGCGRKQMLKETKSKNLVGQKFGKLLVIERLEERSSCNRTLYRCKCDCGNEIVVVGNSLITHHTSSCGCILSYYNMYIDILLDKLNVHHKPEYVVTIDGINYRYDFYLKDYNLMIEYDGEQHYMPVNFGDNDIKKMEENLKRTQNNDMIKNKYCEDNNINLLRIPYWEKANIDKLINDCLQRLSEEDFTCAV